MAEPRIPKNIPARENLAVGEPPVTAPGDANPDLERSPTPGPVPATSEAEAVAARAYAGPSEAATADIEERQRERDEQDDGRSVEDAPPYR